MIKNTLPNNFGEKINIIQLIFERLGLIIDKIDFYNSNDTPVNEWHIDCYKEVTPYGVTSGTFVAKVIAVFRFESNLNSNISFTIEDGRNCPEIRNLGKSSFSFSKFLGTDKYYNLIRDNEIVGYYVKNDDGSFSALQEGEFKIVFVDSAKEDSLLDEKLITDGSNNKVPVKSIES